MNIQTTKGEIAICIKNPKNNKACGKYYVVNEYMKSTADLFLPIYENLFNLVFG